ncbi:MAG TPA: type II secretion system protein [Pyrinomonadaceae bacterium]|jgi:prepilin-type N-terminal cleavage/methylation domain-containing protein
MTNRSISQRGFSLIELLIVVAVIGIIASIAIVYVVQAKQAANSASAINSLRTIHQSESSYRVSKGSYGNMTQLGDSGFINDPALLSTGQKSLYQFTVTPDTVDATMDYTAEGVPLNLPAVNNFFFVNATGVIRRNQGANANALSTPID